MVTQVFLVEMQGRFTVHFIKNIAAGTGHEPFRTKRIPAAEGSIADMKPASVKTDRGDQPAFSIAFEDYGGIFKTIAVRCQSAGNRDPLRQPAQETPDQSAAIDMQAVGKNKDMLQSLFFETFSDSRTNTHAVFIFTQLFSG